MIIQTTPIAQALREMIRGVSREDRVPAAMIRMWDYVLDYHQSEESGRLDPRFFASPNCDAIPYVPVDLENLGIVIKADSQVVDLGCFGGYGLYDFMNRRLKAGLPVPSMLGVDQNPQSIDFSRQMAGIWAQENKVLFCMADASAMPVQPESADLIIARLLLPYVRVRETLREIRRVLKPGGVALFQLHSFGYYLNQMRLNVKSPSSLFYYARPVFSGITAACTGVQLKNKWLSETAMTTGMMERWAEKERLKQIWQGGFTQKPLTIYRKA